MPAAPPAAGPLAPPASAGELLAPPLCSRASESPARGLAPSSEEPEAGALARLVTRACMAGPAALGWLTGCSGASCKEGWLPACLGAAEAQQHTGCLSKRLACSICCLAGWGRGRSRKQGQQKCTCCADAPAPSGDPSAPPFHLPHRGLAVCSARAQDHKHHYIGSLGPGLPAEQCGAQPGATA